MSDIYVRARVTLVHQSNVQFPNNSNMQCDRQFLTGKNNIGFCDPDLIKIPWINYDSYRRISFYLQDIYHFLLPTGSRI